MESMAAARPEGTAANAAVSAARDAPLESRRPGSTRLRARLRKDERGDAGQPGRLRDVAAAAELQRLASA